MKKVIMILALGVCCGLQARDVDLTKMADQGLEQVSQKKKRDRFIRKLEKQLSPEKRAELINDIQNSELSERQKEAMTAVVEAIDDSADIQG